jgi:hypothetical protein
MPMGGKLISSLFAALMISVMTAVTAFAASEFEGVWSVKDKDGKPFEITLSAGGKATSTHAKQMTGTWTEEGGAAVIKWDSGWTTKIVKEGDHYVKQAFKKDGTAASTSDAQKK